MFYRKLYKYLLAWKNKPGRKPLIIRGARQVGKSTLVQEFGKEFRYFISLNLEKAQDKIMFDKLQDIRDIVDAIFLRAGVPMTTEPTLIFLDEIQESPKAVSMLRYFFEDFPHLYIIAAGSLLEFALKKVVSFPVGRVEQVVLHPFDFDEFLLAIKRDDVLNELESVPVKNFAHETLIDLFNDYAIIGGMPEVVKRYAEEMSIINLGEIYSNLWQSYRDDVEKYAANPTERKIIRHIIDTAPFEKDRITLAGFGNSGYRSRETGEAIRALDMARIIQLIYPTTNLQPPAVPDLERKPRLQFLDTGLLNYSTNNQAEMVGLKDLNNFSRGKVMQQLTTQQIQSQFTSPSYKPVFWVREKANSTAEVDLIYQYGKYLLPIEIKSGSHGTLRSLHQFIERCNHKYGIRLLANNFTVEKLKTPSGTPYLLMNMPYYASSRMLQYIEWYTKNYSIG
jgi:predicted AAA+ superfamily ATPase